MFDFFLVSECFTCGADIIRLMHNGRLSSSQRNVERGTMRRGMQWHDLHIPESSSSSNWRGEFPDGT